MELPSLRQVLSKILHALETASDRIDEAAPPIAEGHTPLRTIKSLPEAVKSSFIALDNIFPGTLLSSLDILDHGLATRYILTNDEQKDKRPPPIFYVRSSRSRSSRRHTPNPRTAYEVRPDVWHCTCASFTFKAFSSQNIFDPVECGVEDFPGSDRWGGEMRGGLIPVCKHLLAVVIGERLNVIPERELDINTLANYAYTDAY